MHEDQSIEDGRIQGIRPLAAAVSILTIARTVARQAPVFAGI
jgi:hypothetical protein